MNKYSLSILAVIFSTASLYSPQSYAEDFYEILDLGSFEGGNASYGFSINATNQVAGYSVKDQNTGINRGFLYDDGSTEFTDIGAIDNSEVLVEITNIVDGIETTTVENVGFDDTSSFAFSVNNDGVTVGYSERMIGSVSETTTDGIVTERATGALVERAIYFDSDTLQITELPDFSENDSRDMRATAITNNFIVGTGLYDEPDDLDEDGDEITTIFDRGFIYDINSGVLTKISPLDNELTKVITLRDIDEAGYAVGVSAEKIISISGQLIYINRKVVGVDLNSPEDVVELTILATNSQQVSAINGFKKIVGKANDASETYETAYMHDINTAVTIDLGVLNASSPFSEALDINDRDQIVGFSRIKIQPTTTYSGFIYEEGEMKDLSKMIGCDTGWSIHEARSINNNGFIIGTGILNGNLRAFMLRPIPDQTAPICEDDSLAIGSGSTSLFSLLSLAGLLVVRRKYLS